MMEPKIHSYTLCGPARKNIMSAMTYRIAKSQSAELVRLSNISLESIWYSTTKTKKVESEYHTSTK